jgi:hypothetical protein
VGPLAGLTASLVLAGAGAGAGARLYREGLLPSGRPVAAVVQGDVPVTGAQLACAACHGRSGMGSGEGGKVAPPIGATFLAAPRPKPPRPRPAYDARTLARAVREGIDSAGNRLDPMMPRYRMDDADVAALRGYLRGLSARPSPGAGERALHLATVIAPGADPAAREATLGVLRAYVRGQNAAARTVRAAPHPRIRIGATTSQPEYGGDWVLHVWELSGPPETWRAQLEARQRARPVFAVVSGAGGAEWRPVQRFCDEREIPCLLPNVATPPEAPEGSYARYFSRGAVLEAEVVAAHLARSAAPQRVLQVFRPDGAAAARALEAALAAGKRDAALALSLDGAAPLDPSTILARARSERATALVLWLARADLEALRVAPPPAGVPLYLSSTLLDGELEAARSLGGADGFVAHPFALPVEVARRFPAVSVWLANQGLSLAGGPERRVQDQTLFAARVLGHALAHMGRGRTFFRDYLLEVMDHAAGLQAFSTYYPRLSFGPGQRHLSKGAWLVPLRGPVESAEWVVP